MDFVNVAIRIKPNNSDENKALQVIANDVIFIPERQFSYTFDKVFSEDTTQMEVYNEVVVQLVQKVLSGYNATIFAYGQTGTGKTYTIGSDSTYFDNGEAGLITRTLNDIMNQDENKTIKTSISFIEIYNEKVYDLLSDSKAALQLKGFNINGLSKHQVETPTDAQNLLMEGGKHRHTGGTKQNAKSSRSHAIFTIYCNVKYLGQETEAKLNLVDLAGSESVKKTGNEGNQFHEGVNINKGLLYIGQVINALSNNQSYIPYRESTITTILKDSLNTKNYVTLIACISTKLEDIPETVQTLDFAQRVKKVKNKPELNSIITEYAKSHPQTSKTPFKLSNRINTPNKVFRTPFTPKLKRMPLTLQSSSNLFSSDASTIRFVSTSAMSTIQETPNLSPTVQRYVQAENNLLLSRIQEMVTEMITPMINKNSPRITRSSLAREVKEIVQNQFLMEDFDSFQHKLSSVSQEFSGVDEGNKSNAPVIPTGSSPITSGNKTPMFKKPKTPLVKGRKKQTALFAASSPIRKTLTPPSGLRRSRRISVRQSCSCTQSRKILSVHADVNMPSLNMQLLKRRSKRISTTNNKLTLENKHEETPTLKSVTSRRSVRIAHINNEVQAKSLTPKQIKKKPTQTKKEIKKKQFKNEMKDATRTKQILEIINNGTVKDLTALDTIGPKSANMIYQFRQINGKIRKISELSKMPWRAANAYEKFVLCNFLEPETP